MEPPSNIETGCPKCGEGTMHQVLKGRLSKGKGSSLVLDATVRCSECEWVHHVHIRQKASLKVPVIISTGGLSEKTSVEIPKGEIIEVKDEFHVGDLPVMIQAIESDGRRVQQARTEDVDTIWAIRFDTVTIKVSVYSGRKTSSEILVTQPDDEFAIGDPLSVKGRPATIAKIKVEGRTLRKGGAFARDIIRIYAKAD